MNTKNTIILLVLVMALLLCACGESSEPTEKEIAAINEIFDKTYTVGDLKNITNDAIGEKKDKFKAVKKVFLTPEGDYAFIAKPVAYNGPITIALGIDSNNGTTVGMRIVEHVETEHYVRDLHNNWFIDRFAGKSINNYLKPVRLEANRDNEIVTVTGATVTTEGIVNGVNACMGVYQEHVLGIEAIQVPYMVKFEREEGEGPEETGKVSIRAYGVVLGEVTLEEIREMPSVKRTMSIHSTSGTTKHSFRGTLLSNVIAAVDPELLTTYEWVQTIGVDDYMSNISMEEVMAENCVYLMYEDNGEPLQTKTGQPGAMRVVVLDDVFGQRFTNYLIELVLE
ncbi:MAG: FMN-binding protein [Tepidanaerobacteraceae bacterium]|jgi:Na+-translocating ferredoxin:NAD+ oxidoreductase RnfG subunit|nr:FMN-binding protein [Thermoanaerobacterales bacterium]